MLIAIPKVFAPAEAARNERLFAKMMEAHGQIKHMNDRKEQGSICSCKSP